MTLRKRLILTTSAAAIPLMVAMLVGYGAVKRQAKDDLIASFVLAHFSPAALDACEASPSPVYTTIRLPVRRGGTVNSRKAPVSLSVFTYDRAGRSRQALAPPLPHAMLEEVRNGAYQAGRSVEIGSGKTRHILVALPRDRGPCALALAVVPEKHPPVPPPLVFFVPVLLALIAIALGIGSVVRRVRSLTIAVSRWREDKHYRLPQDGARDEIGELSRALFETTETVSEQHARLSERENALREFIENTTHDLVTPLTVLQGNLSALAMGHDPEAVRQAMNEAQYIGAVLGNLALLAKFKAGTLVKTSFDLCDIVLRVVERHRSMATRLQVSIERFVPEESVIVLGDITFTEQALNNLVSNALRYNDEGGHVAVVLDVKESQFVIRVLDDGPGLTDEERKLVVKRGERGEGARTRDFSGKGIGLSIVAHVAQLQNWRFSLIPGEKEGLVAELRGLMETTPDL